MSAEPHCSQRPLTLNPKPQGTGTANRNLMLHGSEHLADDRVCGLGGLGTRAVQGLRASRSKAQLPQHIVGGRGEKPWRCMAFRLSSQPELVSAATLMQSF